MLFRFFTRNTKEFNIRNDKIKKKNSWDKKIDQKFYWFFAVVLNSARNLKFHLVRSFKAKFSPFDHFFVLKIYYFISYVFKNTYSYLLKTLI